MGVKNLHNSRSRGGEESIEKNILKLYKMSAFPVKKTGKLPNKALADMYQDFVSRYSKEWVRVTSDRITLDEIT